MGVMKILGMLVLLMSLTSIFSNAASAEDTIPSNGTLKLLEEFEEKYGQNWQATWHKYIDSPRLLEGRYPLGRNITNKDEAEAVSKTFIEDNKDLLKINVSELKLSRVYEDWNSFNPEYQQHHNGVPVEQGRVRVMVYKDDSIGYLSNHFYPNISISTTPTITKDEAIAIAKDYFTSKKSWAETSLVILPSDYRELTKTEKSDTLRYYLMWKVKFHEKSVHVDAENGDILGEYPNIVPSTPKVNAGEPKTEEEQNEVDDKRAHTGTNLTKKPEIDKSAPQQTPLLTAKRIGAFVAVAAVLFIVLILWRRRK